MKAYSTIKELIEIIESYNESTRVIDGWKENDYYVAVLQNGTRIKMLYPF